MMLTTVAATRSRPSARGVPTARTRLPHAHRLLVCRATSTVETLDESESADPSAGLFELSEKQQAWAVMRRWSVGPPRAAATHAADGGTTVRPVVEAATAVAEGRSPSDADGELHPVLELLAQRAISGSRPGHRTDPHKLGLVVQGGGMRGVVSAGALTVLHFLGLRRVFDATYGSSAGAMNLTYFLAGQPEGARAYVDDLATKRFVNLNRLLRKRNRQGVAPTAEEVAEGSVEGVEGVDTEANPALDLRILLDDVMRDSKPLDFQAVIDSQPPLKVVASNLDTLQPVMLSDFTSEADLRTCLRASANVPVVAGPHVECRGARLVDAAVFEGVPVPSAASDGCSHVLCLCSASRAEEEAEGGSERQKYWRKRIGAAIEFTVKSMLLNPPYMKAAWAMEAERKEAGLGEEELMAAMGVVTDDPASPLVQEFFGGCHVLAVYPRKEAMVGGKDLVPLSIDADGLEAALYAGMDSMANALRPVTHFDGSSHEDTQRRPLSRVAHWLLKWAHPNELRS